MGNCRNKKKPNKRKAPKKCLKSSAQKVTKIPKNENKKPDPNDQIAMSKQLKMRKNNVRAKRQTSSQKVRVVCENGKPLPSIAELKKYYEDSDEEDTSQNPSCKTPTPQNETTADTNQNKLLSPSTIGEISKRLINFIDTVDLNDLVEAIPPPPIIKPKKRKKTEIPYIVGCKDRPQVIRKPNTNFCKGDDDYGVDPSGQEPDEPPTKRAKKSSIPKYTKSIFNAKSDEIAERLTKDDTGNLSDSSSDSNKTIEYDPTPFQYQRPHCFSPIPSTSRDSETFKKNDEMFNESLKEINISHEEIPIKKEDEVQILDVPCETIVIDDSIVSSTRNDVASNKFETLEPIEIDDDISNADFRTNNIPNDEDCIMVTNSSSTENNISNQPIEIVDEYRNINMGLDMSYDNDVIEVIDIDDVIAENKSILEKWKNNEEAKELNKIITVVDVPSTFKSSNNHQTTVREQTPTTETQTVIEQQEQITQPEPVISNVSRIINTTNLENTQRNRSETTSDSGNNIFSIFEGSTLIETIADNYLDEGPNADNIDFFLNMLTGRLRPAHRNETVVPSLPQNIPQCTTPVTANNSQNCNNNIRNHVRPEQTRSTLPAPTPVPTRNIGDCPICMDPLASNAIASTMCGHVFCLQCLKAAIKSNGKKCPTCRKVLKGAGGGYHQLYL